MSMTSKNASDGVRENDLDAMLALLVRDTITRCLDFRSSLVALRKCVEISKIN